MKKRQEGKGDIEMLGRRAETDGRSFDAVARYVSGLRVMNPPQQRWEMLPWRNLLENPRYFREVMDDDEDDERAQLPPRKS
jgi:hypothetical protein